MNEYQEKIHAISTIIEEVRRNPERYKSMEGFVTLMVIQEGFNKIEALNMKLLGMKERMSLLQYAKFKEAHDIMKTYDKDLK